MIVVLGRPRVYRPEPDGALVPGGLVAEIALAVARELVDVEIVGSLGDDPEGDRVIVELGQAGVGHAALLRDPAARTPGLIGSGETAPLPRLDPADIELGLRYVPQCRVLVLADPLEPDGLQMAVEAADYHGAAVVMIAASGSVDAELLGDAVTLLERPAPEDAEDADPVVVVEADPALHSAADDADFGGFIAEYAVWLDRGEAPAQAFAAALGDSAWEPTTD